MFKKMMGDDDEESEEGIEDKEPQITSSDPNERKLARKLRIERRLDAIRKLNMPEGEKEEVIIEKTLLQQQMQKSFELLEKLTIETNEFVTNVRVANDSREVDRKEEEVINREKIFEQLDEEGDSAKEQFNDIAEKWISILNYNDPLQINDEIIGQKEKCDELIRQKDEIIAMLRNEIRTAEIKFSKDQRKQTEDIETLAHRIEKQVTLMRRAYNKELQLIEDVIMVERRMLIEANDKKWEELHKKRDQEEELNGERKFEQLEEFEKICTNIRVNHQENYRNIKINMETDIEQLQRELEEIKTLALMNSEKLDYNYQILRKREDENIIIKSQQKRKINKLQDLINSTRKKITDYKIYAVDEIGHLTKEVQKLQANVLDIEAKADHFTKINDLKYRQVWNLNKTRAGNILDQILTTDKILYEQQLGLKWENPEQQLLEKTDLPSYKSAMAIVHEIYKKGEETENAHKDKSNSSCEKSLPESLHGETMAHRRILKIILKMIADKSGFLIEGRLKDVLKPYLEDERALIRVDSVFSALGIKRKEDVEVLLEYFLPYTHCPICMGVNLASRESSESLIMSQTLNDDGFNVSKESLGIQIDDAVSHSEKHEPSEPSEIDIMSAIHQPDYVIDGIVSRIVEIYPETILPHTAEEQNIPSAQDDIKSKKSNVVFKDHPPSVKSLKTAVSSAISARFSCHNRHPLIISSVYILRALKEFVSRFYVAEEGPITMTSRLSHKRSTVSRLVVGDEVKMFWDRFKMIFSSNREALWDGLTIGLQKYHEILKDRKKLNDEVLVLRTQNTELKYLLSCYQKDVKKKMKPPCAAQREIPIKPTIL